MFDHAGLVKVSAAFTTIQAMTCRLIVSTDTLPTARLPPMRTWLVQRRFITRWVSVLFAIAILHDLLFPLNGHLIKMSSFISWCVRTTVHARLDRKLITQICINEETLVSTHRYWTLFKWNKSLEIRFWHSSVWPTPRKIVKNGIPSDLFRLKSVQYLWVDTRVSSFMQICVMSFRSSLATTVGIRHFSPFRIWVGILWTWTHYVTNGPFDEHECSSTLFRRRWVECATWRLPSG